MARSRTRSRNRRIALVISGVTILGAGAAIGMGTTFAAEKDRGVCNGLAKAKANNEKFIAAQEQLGLQNPDQAAVFEGRIENRQAVIKAIDSRLKAAGCDDAGAAGDAAQQGNGNQGKGNGKGNGKNAAGGGNDIGCDALATAKANNEKFIAAQEALAQQNPEQAAVFEGRIENRKAVIDLIDSRQEAAGCNDAADDQGEDADDQGEDADDQGEDADDQGAATAGQGGDIGCDNLAKAKANNEKFIAAQEQLAQQNPDQAAVFEGRIANRKAVIDQIDSREAAAGCV